MSASLKSVHLLLMSALILIFLNINNYAETKPAPRKVICLYNSGNSDLDSHDLFMKAQMPLEYIGLRPVFHDISKGLPTEDQMKDTCGIFTWFYTDSMKDPIKYLRWLDKQFKAGKKVVIWGGIGAVYNENGKATSAFYLKKIFKHFNCDWQGELSPNTELHTYKSAVPEMFSFEKRLANSKSISYKIATKEKTLLTASPISKQDQSTCAAIITPKGGFILTNTIYHYNSKNQQSMWIVNPFAYFNKAFGREKLPRPDNTTVNGKRIFFSQIDGDGSISISDTDKKSINVKVCREKILMRYDLPISVGAVEGEIVTSEQYHWIKSQRDVEKEFRLLYHLPNVEPASHGFTHPLHWTEGITAIEYKGMTRKATSSEDKRFLKQYNYSQGSILTPERKEWEERELLGSIKFIEEKLLKGTGKKCKLFQWSGNCRPAESAIALLDNYKILHINGGEYRMDKSRPSCCNVCPQVRHVGKKIQYLAAAANEMMFTENWKRNYFGFAKILETFKNTDFPRRIKPVNLYYHFYSVEKLGSFKALNLIYDTVKKMDLCPVFTSEYVKITRSWLNVEVGTKADGFYWNNNGYCKTLRFDHNEKIPDLQKSKGIIGYYYHEKNKCLYVHLDDSNKGEVYFTEQSQRIPHLSQAGCITKDWERTETSISFTAAVRGKAKATFNGFKPEQKIQLTIDGKITELSADKNGSISFIISKGKNYKDFKVKLNF